MSLAHQSSRPRAGHHGATLRLAAGGHDLRGGQLQDGGHPRKQGGAGEIPPGLNPADHRLDSDLGLRLGPLSAQLCEGRRWHVGLMTFLQPIAKPFYNLTSHAGLRHTGVMGIGARVAQAMERAGLQQEDVAARLGVSQTIVSRIINGKMPGTKHHARLAEILNVSREWIAAGESEPPAAVAPDVASQILGELREIRADIALLLRAAATAGDKDLLNLLDRHDAPQAPANTRPITIPRGSRDGL
jgi:transcriptional regulator with XRE-family HTH domain